MYRTESALQSTKYRFGYTNVELVRGASKETIELSVESPNHRPDSPYRGTTLLSKNDAAALAFDLLRFSDRLEPDIDKFFLRSKAERIRIEVLGPMDTYRWRGADPLPEDRGFVVGKGRTVDEAFKEIEVFISSCSHFVDWRGRDVDKDDLKQALAASIKARYGAEAIPPFRPDELIYVCAYLEYS